MVEIAGPGKLSLGENSKVLGHGKLVTRANVSIPNNTNLVLLGGRTLQIDTEHYFPEILEHSYIYVPDHEYETTEIGPREYIRIKAKQDIPEIGVWAGDLGGKIYNPTSKPASVSMHVSGRSWITPDVVIEVSGYRVNRISLIDSIIFSGSRLECNRIYLNNSIIQGSNITTFFGTAEVYIENSTILSSEVSKLMGNIICILDSIVVEEQVTMASEDILYRRIVGS